MKIKITYSPGEEGRLYKLVAVIRSLMPEMRQRTGKSSPEYKHLYFADKRCNKAENRV